jgi:hypothetical protein
MVVLKLSNMSCTAMKHLAEGLLSCMGHTLKYLVCFVYMWISIVPIMECSLLGLENNNKEEKHQDIFGQLFKIIIT